MKYISTRGDLSVSFSESVLWGLTPEGGLLIPETFPLYTTEKMRAMSKMTYTELALTIIKDFADDIPEKELKKIIEKSYATFSTKEITPTTKIDEETYIVELFHGPTLAFKDVALQFLGNIFEYILTKMNSTTNILTATSGDTGSAAICAVQGKKNLRIFVLTPKGKMSAFQTAQMYSVIDDNVFNIAIDGTFDDCQDMVKKASEEKEFREKYHLGYMNSINWTRILAQIVYYAKGVFDVQNKNKLPIETKIDVTVPTGNFGNILAAHYAKKIGIPIGQIILATNENDVLNEFFKTGVYKLRKKEEVIATNSPSMDISSASNFERFMYEIVNKDTTKVKELWQSVKSKGFFDISQTHYFKAVKESSIRAGAASAKDRAKVMQEIYKRTKIVIDPHTANGACVQKTYKIPGRNMLCMATASPLKFQETITEVLGKDVTLDVPKTYENLEKRPQKFIEMKRLDVDTLKKYIAKNALLDI